MLYWKHKYLGHIVAESCHNKLPPQEQDMYHSTEESATHTVYPTDDGQSWALIALATDIASVSDDNQPSIDTTVTDYGGGSGGGAGATDSY
jgi:hypothetical protein